ncbi:MAG TPA: polysaccharide biosynthesis C-terminal domain-containing protein [Bacteroidales bacterium]|nr:polysaccharide biosynthesis C-terminal domain-containing protein [Bacteroidales bacterium]
MAKRSYFQDILSVLGSNVAVTICNLGIGIILSRLLGAAGFGMYSSIIVVPIMVIGFTQLGIRRSAIYHIGLKKDPEKNIVSALFILLLISSILSILICTLVYLYSESNTYNPLLIGIVFLTIPLLLGNVFAGGFFLGKEQIRRANYLNAAPSVINLVFVILFVLFLRWSVLGAFIAVALANLVTFAFVCRILVVHDHYRITWKYHEHLMKSMVRLGIMNALAIFIMQLNYRFDILMLKKMSTLEEVGFYSLATQIAEQLWHIPYAIETIIMSRSANTKDNEFVNKTVASIFRVSLLIGIVGCLIMFFVSPFLIPLIFGREYVQSVPLIQAILPGILLLVAFRILNSRLIGMGKPQNAIWTFLPALLLNIGLNLLWIPKYGALGSAWATNVSYGAGSLVFIFLYAKKIKMPVLEIFNYRKSDFYFFRDLKPFARWKSKT